MTNVYVVTVIKTGKPIAVFEDSNECISYIDRSTKDTVQSHIVKLLPKGYRDD